MTKHPEPPDHDLKIFKREMWHDKPKDVKRPGPDQLPQAPTRRVPAEREPEQTQDS